MVVVIKHRRRLARVLAVITMVSSRFISVMLMLMVAKVMRLTLTGFMQAIRFHGSPDGLERQQYQQKNGDQSTHGAQYIGTTDMNLTSILVVRVVLVMVRNGHSGSVSPHCTT